MNLYQDFCDGVFYFSFTDCYADDYVPTMSDRFDTMLIKLKNIEWDGITSMETPGLPERFDNVSCPNRILYDRGGGYNLHPKA